MSTLGEKQADHDQGGRHGGGAGRKADQGRAPRRGDAVAEHLGTVHWLANHETGARDPEAVVANVRGWNARKRSQMKKGHILAAFARLREQEWVVQAP